MPSSHKSLPLLGRPHELLHLDSYPSAHGIPRNYQFTVILTLCQVMRQALSTTSISVLLALIALLSVASAINYYAAVTRDLFAFARDNGLPFSRWLSTVHPTKHLPIHAAQVSVVTATLLSLIYIGSDVAFYAITSLATVSLLACYTMSIGSVLWRRVYLPHTLPPAEFSLGRWGVPCNAAAVGFGVWSFFWSLWPQSVPVTVSLTRCVKCRDRLLMTTGIWVQLGISNLQRCSDLCGHILRSQGEA